MADLDILRRIGERGLRQAQEKYPETIDIWQHLLDEIQRFRLAEFHRNEQELFHRE